MVRAEFIPSSINDLKVVVFTFRYESADEIIAALRSCNGVTS